MWVTILVPSCWHRAPPESGDGSLGAGWTDTPDAHSLHPFRSPQRPHRPRRLRAQVRGTGLGHRVGARPESQNWGDPRSPRLPPVQEEESESRCQGPASRSSEAAQPEHEAELVSRVSGATTALRGGGTGRSPCFLRCAGSRPLLRDQASWSCVGSSIAWRALWDGRTSTGFQTSTGVALPLSEFQGLGRPRARTASGWLVQGARK